MAVLKTRADVDRYCEFLRVQVLPLEVGTAPWVKARRDEANDYLWGYVYPPLVAVAGFSALEWHEHFCGERFGLVERVKAGGRVELIPARTTTRKWNGQKYVKAVMKGPEFNDFLAYVESECATKGVFIERSRPV